MKSTEIEMKMPGELVDEDGKKFWRIKSDKVQFLDTNGDRLGYVIESLDQRVLFQKLAGQYPCFAVWQVLKSALSIETGLVHVTQTEMAKRAGMRPAQISKAMKILKTEDLVRIVSPEGDCRTPGLVLDPGLVIIGDHVRARRLWLLSASQVRTKLKAGEWAAKLLELVEATRAGMRRGLTLEEAADQICLDDDEIEAVLRKLRTEQVAASDAAPGDPVSFEGKPANADMIRRFDMAIGWR